MRSVDQIYSFDKADKTTENYWNRQHSTVKTTNKTQQTNTTQD